MREPPAMPPTATATAVCHTPEPSMAETQMAKSVPGMAIIMSIRRMMMMSTLPPK